jgi:NAD-dependent SIR2 family protein deacetylase
MATDVPVTDLLFVCGTSLTVGPANRVPERVYRSTLKVTCCFLYVMLVFVAVGVVVDLT